MLQGSDPFDEFRQKKEIERLENRFSRGAEKKRKRLKELLEEDSADPDQVEKRVQEEMESFFQESASAAEAVFTEVSGESQAQRNEIQRSIEAALQPVESHAAVESRPVAHDDEEADLQAALARLRGDAAPVPLPPDSSPEMPAWLDGDGDGDTSTARTPAPVEDEASRRKRILGAFDASFDRLRGLLRSGIPEVTPGEDIEEIIEEDIIQEEIVEDESVADESSPAPSAFDAAGMPAPAAAPAPDPIIEDEFIEDEFVEEEIEPEEEPPLSRRDAPDGFTPTAPRPAAGDMPVREDPSEKLALEARVDALEQEVSRLWSILHRSGMAEEN